MDDNIICPELATMVADAKRTGTFSYGMRGLTYIPSVIFNITEITKLDLSNNCIETLPEEIGNLVNLEHLWINNNPIKKIPSSIENCKKLKVLDIRNTRLTTLPRQMGTLTNVLIIDTQGVPFEGELVDAVAQGTNAIIEFLRGKNLTQIFIDDLILQLSNNLYFRESLTPTGQSLIKEISEATAEFFKKPEDRKTVLNNLDRLFPQYIDRFDIKEVKVLFDQTRRHKYAKVLLAKLELKLRCLYFNMVQPSDVEKMVNDVYSVLPELDQVQFVIRNLNEIFPPDPKEVNKELVYNNTITLKAKFDEEREEILNNLIKVLMGIYDGVPQEKVSKFAHDLSPFIKKNNYMRKIISQATVYFTEDFEKLKPVNIRNKLMKDMKSTLEPEY